MPTSLDTHAWLWWVTGDRRLSRRAAHAIGEATRGAGVLLSMISVWEVAKKVEKQQLVLDRPLREWMDEALAVAGLVLVEMTPAVLLESCSLPQPFHGDPADQIIAASVRHHGGRLITKDAVLRRYPHVLTLW
jgi:PIN domain nuclease of toxin-antitoxin system